MSNDPQSNSAKDSAQTAQFALQKIYTKDISFESPDPAYFFAKKALTPEINLQLNTESRKLGETVYEVVLNLTVTATLKEEDRTLYLAEVKQAGIFTMANFPQKEMNVMINSFCPNILFPYARELVSNLVERGGFPQMLLAPINFDALYQQHLQKLKKSENAPQSEAKH